VSINRWSCPLVLYRIANRARGFSFFLFFLAGRNQTKLSASRFLRVRKLALHVSHSCLVGAFWMAGHRLTPLCSGPRKNRGHGVGYSRLGDAARISPPIHRPPPAVVPRAARPHHTRAKTEPPPPPPCGSTSGGSRARSCCITAAGDRPRLCMGRTRYDTPFYRPPTSPTVASADVSPS
jgi:hypothetical protein